MKRKIVVVAILTIVMAMAMLTFAACKPMVGTTSNVNPDASKSASVSASTHDSGSQSGQEDTYFTYTIKWNYDGAPEDGKVVYKNGIQTNIPEYPEREKYVVVGFAYDAAGTNPVDFKDLPQKDTTVYACWELEKTYYLLGTYSDLVDSWTVTEDAYSFDNNGTYAILLEGNVVKIYDEDEDEWYAWEAAPEYFDYDDNSNAVIKVSSWYFVYVKEGKAYIEKVEETFKLTVKWNYDGAPEDTVVDTNTLDINVIYNSVPKREGFAIDYFAYDAAGTMNIYTYETPYNPDNEYTVYAIWKEVYVVKSDAYYCVGSFDGDEYWTPTEKWQEMKPTDDENVYYCEYDLSKGDEFKICLGSGEQWVSVRPLEGLIDVRTEGEGKGNGVCLVNGTYKIFVVSKGDTAYAYCECPELKLNGTAYYQFAWYWHDYETAVTEEQFNYMFDGWENYYIVFASNDEVYIARNNYAYVGKYDSEKKEITIDKYMYYDGVTEEITPVTYKNVTVAEETIDIAFPAKDDDGNATTLYVTFAVEGYVMKATVNIDWNYEGAPTGDTLVFTNGEPAEFTAPEREGYEFLYFAGDKDGELVIGEIAIPEDGDTIYAIWKEKTYEAKEGYYLLGTYGEYEEVWAASSDEQMLTDKVDGTVAAMTGVSFKAGDTIKICNAKEDKWLNWAENSKTVFVYDDDRNAVVTADGNYNIYVKVGEDGTYYAVLEKYAVITIKWNYQGAPADTKVYVYNNDVEAANPEQFVPRRGDGWSCYDLTYDAAGEEYIFDYFMDDATYYAQWAKVGYYLLGTYGEYDDYWTPVDGNKLSAADGYDAYAKMTFEKGDELCIMYVIPDNDYNWYDFQPAEGFTFNEDGDVIIPEDGEYEIYVKDRKAYISKIAAPQVEPATATLNMVELFGNVGAYFTADCSVNLKTENIDKYEVNGYEVKSVRTGDYGDTGLVSIWFEGLDAYPVNGKYVVNFYKGDALVATGTYAYPVKENAYYLLGNYGAYATNIAGWTVHSEGQLMQAQYTFAIGDTFKVWTSKAGAANKGWIAWAASDYYEIDFMGNAVMTVAGEFTVKFNEAGNAYLEKAGGEQPPVTEPAAVTLTFVEAYSDHHFHFTAVSEYAIDTANYVKVNGVQAWAEYTKQADGTYAFKVYVGDIGLAKYSFEWYDATASIVATATYTQQGTETYTIDTNAYYLLGTYATYTDQWTPSADAQKLGTKENYAAYSKMNLAAGNKIKIWKANWIEWEASDCFTYDDNKNAVISADGEYEIYVKEGKAYLIKVSGEQPQPTVEEFTMTFGEKYNDVWVKFFAKTTSDLTQATKYVVNGTVATGQTFKAGDLGYEIQLMFTDGYPESYVVEFYNKDGKQFAVGTYKEAAPQQPELKKGNEDSFNDIWTYWYVEGADWGCGSAVTMKKADLYKDGTIALTYQGGSVNYAVQLFYTNTNLERGKQYKLTCTIYASKAMSVQVNGKTFALSAGENNISVVYTTETYTNYESIDDFDAQFPGSEEEVTVKVANVSWAEYVPTTCTITVKWNYDGAGEDTEITVVDGEYTLPTPPVREGYTFVWYAFDANGEQMVPTDGSAPERDVTVYAIWYEIDQDAYYLLGSYMIVPDADFVDEWKPISDYMKMTAKQGYVAVYENVFFAKNDEVKIMSGKGEWTGFRATENGFEVTADGNGKAPAEDFYTIYLVEVTEGERTYKYAYAEKATFKFDATEYTPFKMFVKGDTTAMPSDYIETMFAEYQGTKTYINDTEFYYVAPEHPYMALYGTYTTGENATMNVLGAVLVNGYRVNPTETLESPVVFGNGYFDLQVEEEDGFTAWIRYAIAGYAETSTITVKWNYTGAGADTEITVTNGKYELPTPPAREGYNFVWYAFDANGEQMVPTDGSAPDKDVTVYAIWYEVKGDWYLLGTYGKYEKQWAPIADEMMLTASTAEGYVAEMKNVALKEGNVIKVWGKTITTANGFIDWATSNYITHDSDYNAIVARTGNYNIYVKAMTTVVGGADGEGEPATVTRYVAELEWIPVTVTVTVDWNYDGAPENSTLVFADGVQSEASQYEEPDRLGNYTLEGFMGADGSVFTKAELARFTADVTVYAVWKEVYHVNANAYYLLGTYGEYVNVWAPTTNNQMLGAKEGYDAFIYIDLAKDNVIKLWKDGKYLDWEDDAMFFGRDKDGNAVISFDGKYAVYVQKNKAYIMGEFVNGGEGTFWDTWSYWYDGDVTLKKADKNGDAMEITYNGGTQSYSVQMFYDNTKLEKGKKYTLAFFAYASADLTVTFNNKSYELIAGETELISVVYEHGSNVGYMGLSDFDAQFMGVKAETTIRISMVTWTEYEEEPAPANAIPNAQNQAMVLANPDTYYYWNDQNWCGSNVTVSQATMDDGVATLTYSGCNENCWFGMQFMYKNSKLTAGKPYKLTLKINASAAGNVTVNGKVFKLAVGDNEIAVEYYESANDYSMQVLFGVSSGEGNTGTVIAAGTFKISNIAWASTFTGEADKYYLIGKLGDNEVWYNVNAAYVFGAGDEQNTAILSNATLHAGDKIKAATGDGNVWFNWGESADNAACFDKDADGNAIIKADGTYNVYLSNRMLYIAKVQTEPKVVTVTVKWGIDGVTDTTITFTNGVASAYTVPTNEGYTLKAWRVYEEDGIHYVEVALNTVPTEDVTVYAVWEKPVVIVPGYYLLGNYGDYAPNGCWSVVGDDQPVMGTSEGLSAFGVYAFKANDDLMMWHQITSNDWQWVMWQAGECFDLTGGFKDHATIKADGRYYVYVYGDKAYITAAAPTVVKLTVNYNYGETPTVKEYYFVNGEVEGFVTPTRDGFTFKGFSTDAAGNDMVPMQAPQTNMTVYAQWEPEQQAPQTSVTIELDIAGASEWFFNDKAVVYIHVWYTDSTTATVAMTEQDGKYYFTTAADKTLAGLVFYRVNPNANPDEQNFIWNQSVDVTDFTNGYSFALTGEEENGKLKVETFNNGNGGNAGNDGGANGEGGAGQP